ncbi:hypothetical protein AMTR_s00100p00141790 [Amborella trichopoda]|uniref:Uncharacterized protein n=1 Tax=Amborella trichopoda TaxID=13333 RepID=W1NYS2_AMBTC|nr:hypothetical protein AMTR_s00100p00141790 [Amborella trichopoda]
MPALGTSSTISTSIGVNIMGGRVETVQISTFAGLMGGAAGVAPAVDEPLLFGRVLFFKIVGADWGPFDPFLFSPSYLFSPTPRGTLLSHALVGIL